MSREIYVPDMRPGEVQSPSREIYASMGEANILRMMEDFYRELEQSPIREMFPPDMLAAARKNATFFVQVMGGPPLYNQRFGNPMMRARHMPFYITPQARNVWLTCFLRVLQTPEKYNFPMEHLEGFKSFLRGFSMWMVNTSPPPAASKG